MYKLSTKPRVGKIVVESEAMTNLVGVCPTYSEDAVPGFPSAL